MISNSQNMHHPTYRDLNSYDVEWRVMLGNVTVFSSREHLDAVIFRINYSFLNPERRYRLVGVLIPKNGRVD